MIAESPVARWPLAAAWIVFAWICLPPESAAQEATNAEARAIIRDAGERMIDSLEARRAELERDPVALYGLVEEIILPYFDFQTISRLVLGKYWRSANSDQRSRFTEEFKTLLVRSYATAWLEYEGQEIRFLPARPSRRADRTMVRLELIEPYSSPVLFSYSLHNKTGQWLIYDVAVDGISLLTNYRVSISENVKAKGLETTIVELEERNEDRVER